MAFRHSLCKRSGLIAQRYRASFTYIPQRNEDHGGNMPDVNPNQRMLNNVSQRRSFASNVNKSAGLGAFFKSGSCSTRSSLLFSPSIGSSFHRYMSTAVGESADKLELLSDVITDTTVQAVASQAPAVSEVAIAAADSYFPVMALQYLIDYVHQFTGFNWWASIVVTTLLIRTATIPLMINQLKSTSKLAIIKPRMEEIKAEMDAKGMDPIAMAEGQGKMKQLFKESGVNPFTPLKGIFIQGPIFISFFLAVTNMAEKVPSFKTGGAYWFSDLTTPDALYIFPVLTGLTFLITVESNTLEGMQENPMAGTIKNVFRAFAVLTVPFTASFPKAIFCYWMTTNIFSLLYGLVLKHTSLKKVMGVPEIPVASKPAPGQPALSVFSALKQLTSAVQEPTSAPAQPSKFIDRRTSSSSVLSQRLRSLEKEVKGRKKSKKR
ncbi:mitochondrial inner membrane protein OXA1-like isoform X3 [Rhodamnia argentea]|uniref:Mitochondrial inner membrane protein OXA1-like isoform X1 n=1 Tax=Rhodamnia argentea TaxID=178133 RepID=A0A8B8QTI1_9MYRT|nr:mitochondrial inner membrane protein OXA1-like isoform X1 [Rhodamnia argentea]XP_030549618.2 mitochondrial inner membrane protein OXA1-like isoform X1 [Rhodamnia argentea]XP_048131924.1 mitochondrial inner membrane protein OXA1-like isoform X1 [Rhodamnia argentea]XP_048131925.1 mitochondrial inner membrane protein OXA1-like isoform X3 [Rhodamnia argentea]XP_048131926.1 mitochondrial inner membrane protein OXA1-like isoform X3 [Rhodamnia argentea]